MNRERWLAAISAGQLAAGVVGLAIAVRRRHPYDVPLLHGRPENVARDAVVMGTALSAPVVMLVAQGMATARVLRSGSTTARFVLGGLGAAMVAGYLGERHVRERLRPSGWDALESSVVVGGISLAATMGVLGLVPPHRSR